MDIETAQKLRLIYIIHHPTTSTKFHEGLASYCLACYTCSIDWVLGEHTTQHNYPSSRWLTNDVCLQQHMWNWECTSLLLQILQCSAMSLHLILYRHGRRFGTMSITPLRLLAPHDLEQSSKVIDCVALEKKKNLWHLYGIVWSHILPLCILHKKKNL